MGGREQRRDGGCEWACGGEWGGVRVCVQRRGGMGEGDSSEWLDQVWRQ